MKKSKSIIEFSNRVIIEETERHAYPIELTDWDRLKDFSMDYKGSSGSNWFWTSALPCFSAALSTFLTSLKILDWKLQIILWAVSGALTFIGLILMGIAIYNTKKNKSSQNPIIKEIDRLENKYKSNNNENINNSSKRKENDAKNVIKHPLG